MPIFKYTIKTTYGEAYGSIEAKDEESARTKLASQFEGQLADEDGNELNNATESIDLTRTK